VSSSRAAGRASPAYGCERRGQVADESVQGESDDGNPGGGEARPCELFETSEVETLELHETFNDWLRYWERQGYPAGTTVPARFRTQRLTCEKFPLSSTKWELRALPWRSLTASNSPGY
jgi:hypothetical protein